MVSKIFSAATIGLEAKIIEVEVEASYGLSRFTLVGLPDKAVEESKERVTAAIKSSGFKPPGHQPARILVSLAPADIKKEGSLYDLPIAIGFLASDQQIRFDAQSKIFIGELALDGRLRPIRGAISFAILAKEKKFEEIILPRENAREAALIKDLKVIGAASLREIIDHLAKRKTIHQTKTNLEELEELPKYSLDIGWIKGQGYAKRALEIAAAGGHNLMMQGPPGTGKTLLAQALPSLLPPLAFEESLEVTKIYSISGFLPKEKPLITIRPFRSPHHTSSEVALIGGGNPPRPGEITLAHRGVLFMDEFPEFHRDVLESLRQPLEEGQITLLRSKHRLTLPARFTLIAAANPCPCGYYRDSEKPCRCPSSQIAKYRRKLSGPLMDRFDLFIDVPQLKYEELIAPGAEQISEQIRQRVQLTRNIQKERLKQEKILTNAEMRIPQIKKYCQIGPSSQRLLKAAIDSGKLSVRGFHRVLKTSRTIADLDGSEKILPKHVQEALSYRLRED